MFGKGIFYGGIGIAIVGLLFLVVPLWLRNVDHPLTADAAVDVCAYVSDAVIGTLPRAPATIERGVPGESDPGKPACRLELPAADDAEESSNVWVMVTTERMLNTGQHRPLRTDRFVDTWLKESAVSGSEVTPVQGPWRRGAVIRDQGHPERLGLLADDAGVVVWVNAEGIEYPAFTAFAEAITRGLRGKPGAAAPR